MARELVRQCERTDVHDPHDETVGDVRYFCTGIGQYYSVTSSETTRDLAESFMTSCGLHPTPDAIGQLTEVFLPCLRIMCERGYDPDGATWRAEGWRGMLWKAYDKMERLWYHSWKFGRFHDDSVFDGINYLAFYWRARKQGGDGWGKRGAPGNE